jgi:lipid-binding SYLF domain-containing protein
MFTMGGACVGFQTGGKATDVVFLAMNPEVYHNERGSGFAGHQ